MGGEGEGGEEVPDKSLSLHLDLATLCRKGLPRGDTLKKQLNEV